MNTEQITDILRKTLEDGRVSRGEKKALRAVLGDLAVNDLAAVRRIAFEIAREEAPDSRSGELIDWLEDVIGATRGAIAALPTCEVLFSPGEDCLSRIRSLVAAAKTSIDICVYTVTDDRISRRIHEAHERGVKVRIIADDLKTDDPGSDIDQFRTLGIPVLLDDSRHQMHHKFAVFDGRTALTGSYNWTRSAAEHNQENVVVSDDPRLVKALSDEFERLWKQFS